MTNPLLLTNAWGDNVGADGRRRLGMGDGLLPFAGINQRLKFV